MSNKQTFTASDYEELRKAYRFIPEVDDERKRGTSSNWQERMALNYEKGLYREYVLADLTRVHLKGSPVGLRWRTKGEVLKGKGEITCGNKHCPSYDDSNFQCEANVSRSPPKPDDTCDNASKNEYKKEVERLSKLRYGEDLHSFEVPFTYKEEGVTKSELVKVNLCARCAPLLFYHKGWVLGAKLARDKKESSDSEEKYSRKRKSAVSNESSRIK